MSEKEEAEKRASEIVDKVKLLVRNEVSKQFDEMKSYFELLAVDIRRELTPQDYCSQCGRPFKEIIK